MHRVDRNFAASTIQLEFTLPRTAHRLASPPNTRSPLVSSISVPGSGVEIGTVGFTGPGPIGPLPPPPDPPAPNPYGPLPTPPECWAVSDPVKESYIGKPDAGVFAFEAPPSLAKQSPFKFSDFGSAMAFVADPHRTSPRDLVTLNDERNNPLVAPCRRIRLGFLRASLPSEPV
jgi:hypothetical protein